MPIYFYHSNQFLFSKLSLVFDFYSTLRRNREKDRRKCDLLIIDASFTKNDTFFTLNRIY